MFLNDRGRTFDPSSAPNETVELYSVPSYETGRPEIIEARAIGSSKQHVEPGDVLLCKINPRINRVWVVGRHSPYAKVASTEWIRFGSSPALLPHYLRRYLSTEGVRSYLALNVSGVGGSLMRVKGSTIAGFPVPIPTMDVQRAVVARIDDLFAEIDEGEAALAEARAGIKTYRKSLLKAAVTGELTADWRLQQPPRESGAELLRRVLVERRERWLSDLRNARKAYVEPAAPETSELPDLPEGWVWASAEQLCDFITKGTTPAKSSNIDEEESTVPFVRVTNLTDNGRLDFSEAVYVSPTVHTTFLGRSICRPGDVLMNIVGPPLGQVSIVPDEFPEWNINQAIARFRPASVMSARFLALVLLSTVAQNWLAARAKTSAGQVNLTLELCRALPIPLPPFAEQRECEKVFQQLSSGSVVVAGDAADPLRQSILAAAFRGELNA